MTQSVGPTGTDTDTRNASTKEKVNVSEKDALASTVIDSVDQSDTDKSIMSMDKRADASAETMAEGTHDDYPAQDRNGSSQSRRVGNQRG